MSSSSVNSYASVSATLIEALFKELDLNPEQLHQKREKMIAALGKFFSDNFCPEKGLKAYPTDDDPNLNHALPDSLFMKDLAPQIWMENNEFFINTVHCCLVEAGMEEEAQDYLEKVRTAIESGVEIESMKIWSLIATPSKMLKQVGDMGFFKTSGSFQLPSPKDLFPTPQPGWKPNKSNNNPGPCLGNLNQSNLIQYEPEIAAEVEDSHSTPMEETSLPGLVHIGEVTAESMIDAAAEETQKDMMEVVVNLEITSESMIDAASEETQKDMMEVVENLDISSN